MKFKKLQIVVFFIFIILICLSIIFYTLYENEFDPKGLQQTVLSFGVWAPIIFIALYIMATVFIPSSPFMVLSGMLFGFKMGMTYSLIGGFVSAILVFMFSRFLGKNWVESILQKKYFGKLNSYNQKLESKALLDLIILRILPIMPFNALNILMGVSRIGARNYILGTMVGLIPSTVITVYFGDLLVRIF
ncbi:MAG: VTT domain-containing protein [Patescibacteria group bacterium]